MKKIYLTFCLWSAVCAAIAQTITLQPDGSTGIDALIKSAGPEASMNYGTLGDFAAVAWTAGGPFVHRSMIKFDLTGLPANANITSAKLSLYHNPNSTTTPTHSGSNKSILQRITSSWDESTVSWMTKPTSTNTNEVSLAASTSGTQDYLDIDVTQLVKDMITNTNYGIMIMLETESPYAALNFCSSDHPTAAKRPKMVISYTINTGTGTPLPENTLAVYPNPASGFIDVQGAEENAPWQLYDLNGREVMKGLTGQSGTRIYFNEGLAKGIYMFRSGLQYARVAVQ
jgi:hypothetical protein